MFLNFLSSYSPWGNHNNKQAKQNFHFGLKNDFQLYMCQVLWTSLFSQLCQHAAQMSSYLICGGNRVLKWPKLCNYWCWQITYGKLRPGHKNLIYCVHSIIKPLWLVIDYRNIKMQKKGGEKSCFKLHCILVFREKMIAVILTCLSLWGWASRYRVSSFCPIADKFYHVL